MYIIIKLILTPCLYYVQLKKHKIQNINLIRKQLQIRNQNEFKIILLKGDQFLSILLNQKFVYLFKNR
jgi:hypothetical protein